MTDYPNPFDPENQMRVGERRDMSHVGILRRTAYRFEQQGQTATALLFRNAAFILENPDMKLDKFSEWEPGHHEER